MSIVCVAQYIALLFFFNDTATTEIYTLSLHDALPISRLEGTAVAARRLPSSQRGGNPPDRSGRRTRDPPTGGRSEEHTSELQSQSNLVCRLLLEKKKKTNAELNHTYPESVSYIIDEGV